MRTDSINLSGDEVKNDADDCKAYFREWDLILAITTLTELVLQAIRKKHIT